jgi:hypothetical protein
VTSPAAGWLPPSPHRTVVVSRGERIQPAAPAAAVFGVVGYSAPAAALVLTVQAPACGNGVLCFSEGVGGYETMERTVGSN